MGPRELISCYVFNNNDFCSLIYHYECIGLKITNAKFKPLAVTVYNEYFFEIAVVVYYLPSPQLDLSPITLHVQ